MTTLDSAVISASKVRDRFSMDGWTALNDLSKSARRFSARLSEGDDTARATGVLLRKVSGFAGLVHENMYRFVGWRFMSIGRALERCQFMLANLIALGAPNGPDGALDLAVEIADSAMTHRRRYAVSTNRETVLDLLALDGLNPRSVLYSANELLEHVGFLPGSDIASQKSPLARAALRMQADRRRADGGGAGYGRARIAAAAGVPALRHRQRRLFQITRHALRHPSEHELRLRRRRREWAAVAPDHPPQPARPPARDRDGPRSRAAPAGAPHSFDFFGNSVVEAAYREVRGGLSFQVQARVDREFTPPALDLSPRLQDIEAIVMRHRSLGPQSPHHFTGPSGASSRMRRSPPTPAPPPTVR